MELLIPTLVDPSTSLRARTNTLHSILETLALPCLNPSATTLEQDSDGCMRCDVGYLNHV